MEYAAPIRPPAPAPAPAPAAPVASSRPIAPLVDAQYGLEEEEEEDEVQSQEPQTQPAPHPRPQPDIQQPDTDPEADEPRVLSDWEDDDEADPGQIGGARTLKRIKFNEIECRRAFPDAILCKTYNPSDFYADLHTVLFSFRDVIQRELLPIVTFHPGVKAWIGLTNLYDLKNKGVDKDVSIKTAPVFISSEVGIDDLIVSAEKYILGRNSSITVLDSGLQYIRNINITLKVAEWDIGAAGSWTTLPPGLLKKIKSLLNIQNKGNMCFAFCIAAYLLRPEAAARRAR